jgi:hypothetical protein
MSDWHLFRLVLVRDPYLFFELLFIDVPIIYCWYIYMKLREAGFKSKPGLTLPALWWGAQVREYARLRAKYGWPAWPLHVMWVGLVIGIPLVWIGVSKL